MRKLSTLFHRKAPEQKRDITCRSIVVRADTVDLEGRSVEAVMSTEEVVTVFDWERFLMIDEILLARGAELPDQVVVLENHWRTTIDDVFGSARNLRVEGTQTVGRVFFADGDERVDRAWTKYRDGHARDVSVGYKPLTYTDIKPGERKTIAGKEYQARDRVLRVTTRWKLRELSLTPIGADERAKTRNEPGPEPTTQGVIPMKDRLRKYLESIGLRAGVTDDEAKTFQGFLSGRQGQIAEILAREDPNDEGSRMMARLALEQLGVNADDPAKPLVKAESHPGATVRTTAYQVPPATATEAVPVDVAATRSTEEILTEERTRVAMVRRVAGDDLTPEVIDQAVREGWDEPRVSQATVEAIRANRAPAVGQGPAIHSRSREQDCTADALGAAIMIRSGLDPVTQRVRFVGGAHVPRREGENTDAWERAAERGHEYRDWSLVEIARESCRLDGITPPNTRGDMIRAAVSGSALTNIFTTSVNAQLVSGYTDAPDSTDGWTSSSEVPNFQTNERIAMGKFGALKRLARSKTAEHLDESDTKEEYKIARYAGQFVIDEQDIIDDRLGAVDQVSPSDMGASAAQLRPNLVFAILLANANLADTGALFNSTAETTAGGHANLTTDAFDAAGLQAAIVAVSKHRIRTRPLNIRPRFLITPQDIRFEGQVVLKSAQRDADGLEGNYNPLRNEGIDLRFDDRCGVGGVTDPATEIAYAGTATNWFLAARPGENGAKTIEVGYLRGTGRSPQSRSFVLTQGQWGIGWDINMDIGAKALDYRALHMSDGSA